MIAHWQWLLKTMVKQLWFRAVLFSLAGLVAALLALVFKPYIPETLALHIGADAVDRILNIIASSMLAVTTFSLSIMVASYSSASTMTTPRAIPLLMEDNISQNSLGTFLGSFLFSVVAIVALSTGVYGDQGRVLLFAATLVIIMLIVYALLRWIDHLGALGRVSETTDKVEQVTSHALRIRATQPYLGGRMIPDSKDWPASLEDIYPDQIGYVQLVDTRALEAIAEDDASEIYLHVLPGSFVDPSKPLASCTRLTENTIARIREAISVGVRRTFDQDPRFGLSVLSEIASRALSPATNDIGTAIDIIGRGVRILHLWADRPRDDVRQGLECPHVYVPGLQLDDLFDDVFASIARDGAGIIPVGIRLQKAFSSLRRMEDPEFRTIALRYSAMALRHAEAALPLEEDRQLIRQLAVATSASEP